MDLGKKYFLRSQFYSNSAIITVITKEKSTLKADSTTNTAITKEGESRNNPFSIAHKTIYRNYSGLRINQITDNKINLFKHIIT